MPREITSDLDVECNGWTECSKAFRTAGATLDSAATRMRAARTEVERDKVRAEVRGFCRLLALGMLALADPGTVVDLKTTQEDP